MPGTAKTTTIRGMSQRRRVSTVMALAATHGTTASRPANTAMEKAMSGGNERYIGQTMTPWYTYQEVDDIYDPWNNNFNGVCEDGAIPWIVSSANMACNVIAVDVLGKKS
jgi:hypothetical protein